ncbi:hypothetical protein SUGI_0694230 [Cryptomeria japonica]|uniref:oleosin n=1 Tax=Cryptomeria japonica TaxID=3369 RepID=UPI0024147C07|nr:oleosin [Cryptomeria japonica]GLJ34523.1 hypothetical protein SUGI_0694230 [Cryptomeria japonica]
MAEWCEGLMNKIHSHAPDLAQVFGSSKHLITGSILLLLAGLTAAGIAILSIVLAPVLILLSPILIPVGTVLFVTIAGLFLVGISMLGFILGVSWLYSYVRGRNPPGSDRVDYARLKIADTASHVKDYAMEYGAYLQGKVREVAPGA